MRGFLLSMTLALLVAGGMANQASAFVITTDASWRATDVAPGTGWNTSLGFDDSSGNGWGSAVVVNSATLDGDPVSGIWFNGTESSGPLDVWFRVVFSLSDTPTSGFLTIGVDDDAEVYLNGDLVIQDLNGVASIISGVNVLSSLQAGQNLLAVRAIDTGGFHAFQARLTVEVIPEPGAGLLVCLGLVGLTVLRQRK